MDRCIETNDVVVCDAVRDQVSENGTRDAFEVAAYLDESDAVVNFEVFLLISHLLFLLLVLRYGMIHASSQFAMMQTSDLVTKNGTEVPFV